MINSITQTDGSSSQPKSDCQSLRSARFLFYGRVTQHFKRGSRRRNDRGDVLRRKQLRRTDQRALRTGKCRSTKPLQVVSRWHGLSAFRLLSMDYRQAMTRERTMIHSTHELRVARRMIRDCAHSVGECVRFSGIALRTKRRHQE